MVTSFFAFLWFAIKAVYCLMTAYVAIVLLVVLVLYLFCSFSTFFEGVRIMCLFNSFQLVRLFPGMPFLLIYLSGAEWQYATVAFWAALASHVVSYFIIWRSVYDSSRQGGPF